MNIYCVLFLVLGCLPGLLPFGWFNVHLFGGLFELSYQHQAVLVSGELAVAALSVYQVRDEINWISFFHGTPSSFFTGMPALYLGFPAGFLLFARRSWRLALVIASFFLVLFVFVGFYRGFPGSFGNRYLFLCYILGGLLIAIALEEGRRVYVSTRSKQKTNMQCRLGLLNQLLH